MRLTNFDMDALRSFVTGIECGTFADAAGRLGRSTSAVSAQLRKLEDQAGTTLLRKSGRLLQPTEAGEILLAYARRILALNDEASVALRGTGMEGWLRLGLQEDFAEAVLTDVLGRFARAHPKVRLEARIARSSELIERVRDGRLDLALALDDGGSHPRAERLTAVPLCWIGSATVDFDHNAVFGEIPLVSLEAPCILRSLACEALDRAGIAWRMSFVTPSVGGLWAATAAGLGLALRTPIGRPPSTRVLVPAEHGLPDLPKLDLLLHHAGQSETPAARHLADLLGAAVRAACPPT